MFVSSARLVLIISSLLAAVSNAVPQAKPVKQKAEDPAVYTVKVLLHQQSIGFSDAVLEKESERLGDRVGTALLKIFNAKELKDPQNIRRFLPIIRSAFLYPTLVPAQYRKPKVTLRLLDRLERKVADDELKHQISEVTTFVTEQTRPKQAIRP
jgi:hypothetical protein